MTLRLLATQLPFAQIRSPVLSPQIFEEGDQSPWTFGASPSPASKYPSRSTKPVYLPPRSPEPYPHDGPVTHARASLQVLRHDEPISWIFNLPSVYLDA